MLFLTAKCLNLGVEWLADYSFDIFEGSSYVQTGGSSVNYWNTIHTQSVEIKNDPEPFVEGLKGLMKVQEEFFLKYYEPKVKL